METQAKLRERYEAALEAGVKHERLSKTVDRLPGVNWEARCLDCLGDNPRVPAQLVGFVVKVGSETGFGKYASESHGLPGEKLEPVAQVRFHRGVTEVECRRCKRTLDVTDPRIVGKTAWLREGGW